MDTASTDDKTGEALKAQRFQMLEDIAKELEGEVVFPTAFDLVMRLRKALQNPDIPLERIAEMISLDPLISARLIGLANSAAYSRCGPPLQSVKAAVNRLGMNAVRSTALAIAMNQLLRSKELVVFSEIADRVWRHSLHTAAAAEVLARHQGRINADEAMLAGLVHDLGAFYMLYRASQYSELKARPDTVKYVITQWHESIGQALLVALGLPEAISDAVRDHDVSRPCPVPLRHLADVVYVANVMAGGTFEWLLREKEDESDLPPEVDESYLALTPEIDAREEEMRRVFG